MAGKTSIANPVVVLGLDAGPFTAGLEKAKAAGSAASKKISEAAKGNGAKSATLPTAATRGIASATQAKASGGGLLGEIGGAGGGLLSAVKAPMMALAAANQVFELGAKVNKVLGAPVRALMDREQLQAQFSGTGTIDPMGGTFTAGIARFGATFETMLADIAESLDRTFDLKGKLEYIRGALSGVSALMTAFFGNLEPIVKDPEALTKQFKAGALMVVDVFEWVANTSKDIYEKLVSALDRFGINIKLINDVFSGVIDNLKALNPAGPGGAPNTFIGDIQDGLAMLGGAIYGFVNDDFWDLPNELMANRQGQIAAQNNPGGGGGLAMPAADAPMIVGQGPNIAGVAQQARDNINAMGLMAPADREKLLMQQAGVIMGKIGGDLGPQIASKIAPLMTSGSAQLEDALVKAQLQGEAGDIQKRIEAAIKAQINIQTQQAKTLERIRAVIAGDPGLAILGNN